MRKKKKIYAFIFNVSLAISLITTLMLFFILPEISVWFLVIYGIFSLVSIFFILHYGMEMLLSREIQKIYRNNAVLKENFSLKNTTDIDALEKELLRFIQHKKNEIEDLKFRENYRKEFIGNVSHELNTPLFTIQAYILTLLEGNVQDKNIRRKYLQRAAKGVERLIFIVKDLEMISQLESGTLTLNKSPFNIIEVIEFVFDLFEIRAKKRNISLIFNKPYPPIWVFADREKIQQVIANILMNSIKYGKENGTTEVAIEILNPQKIIIRIADNGEGVAKENIHRLFERFYRVDRSGNRKQGGSGLGLSIVKHLIEAHGESVYVESHLGLGSEFSFTLQKATAPV